jgi:tRNA pseudouridine13 synthase
MKPNAFSFAGTKDKRGVTVQQVTAERVLASRLAQLNKPGMTGFVLGDFRYIAF